PTRRSSDLLQSFEKYNYRSCFFSPMGFRFGGHQIRSNQRGSLFAFEYSLFNFGHIFAHLCLCPEERSCISSSPRCRMETIDPFWLPQYRTLFVALCVGDEIHRRRDWKPCRGSQPIIYHLFISCLAR